MNEWNKISFAGEWQLNYISEEDYQKEVCHIRTVEELSQYGEGCIQGRVPGNFELDLERTGILPEIFFGTNPLLVQRYEKYHVYYSRKFIFQQRTGYIPRLVFEGIDTISEIYLNGEKIANTDNMFIPYNIEPDNLIEGENEVIVHLFPVCIETRKNTVSVGNNAVNKYNFESLRLRKAAHMFGWDIMPRLVSCGIYRSVYIEYRPIEYIKQAYLVTTAVDTWRKEADLFFFYELNIEAGDLSDYMIELTGICDNHSFTAKTRLWYTAGRFGIHVEDAQLWWPKNSGEPKLYQVKVELRRAGSIVDTSSFLTGIRTVELIRTGTTDAFFNGKFQFKVNGEKVFIMGTNFVPIDAFHSRDKERLPQVCELLEDIGCNAIRMWGGNLYEDDYLYDFCDSHGILIWQDFMMACAQYPNDDEFGKIVADEAKIIVRRLRHHTSIMIWAGDNEVDMFTKFEPFQADPNRNRITRDFIPNILAYEDPSRPYLPSSPYIDKDSINVPADYLTECHLWGPRDYFRNSYYTDSVCNFASEIGYHGCNCIESIYRFMPKEEAWPWQDNENWAVHAACPETIMENTWGQRIELMADQIKEMFGVIPDNIEDFALASQISQAEAYKFFIELFRLGRWNRTGIIWWNLIDGWPQFSDAVVDYYFNKKLAYYYIRQVQKPVLLSFSEPKDWAIALKAVNDTGKSIDITYHVTDIENQEIVLSGNAHIGDEVFELAKLRYFHGEKKIYLIEWEYENKTGKNHYLFGEPSFDLEFYRNFIEKTYQLDCWIKPND